MDLESVYVTVRNCVTRYVSVWTRPHIFYDSGFYWRILFMHGSRKATTESHTERASSYYLVLDFDSQLICVDYFPWLFYVLLVDYLMKPQQAQDYYFTLQWKKLQLEYMQRAYFHWWFSIIKSLMTPVFAELK